MNKKRNFLIVIGTISLSIFGIIVALMLYMQKDAIAQTKTSRGYVAIKDINIGHKIDLNDIELRELPQSYIGTDTLEMKDILGHFAQVDISKNDLIRAEKLTLTSKAVTLSKVEENTKEAVIQNNLNDTVSVPLNLFKNPDTTLHNGDHIDLIGISLTGDEKPFFTTRYIALNVAVIGFMKEGKKLTKISSVSTDSKTGATTPALADEIILEMNPREISRMLSMYYRAQELNNNRVHNPHDSYQGHLWMVKSNLQTHDDALKLGMMNPKVTHKPKPAVRQSALPPLPKLVSTPTPMITYEK
jgi:hypothetical protein